MDKFKAWMQTKNGKIVTIAVVFLVGILVYVKMRKSTPSQPVPALSVSPQGTSDGSIPASGSASVAPTPPVESPSQKLSDWYSQIEGTAIGANPNDAALIDATLSDMQNGMQLTPTEASEWQKILASFGAPPVPVGSQLNLVSNVGNSKTPIGANANTVSGSNFAVVGTQAAGQEDPGAAVFFKNSDGSFTHVTPSQLASAPSDTPIYAEVTSAGTAGNQHLTPGQAIFIQEPNGSYYHVSPGQLTDIIAKNPNQPIYTESK